VSPPTAPNPIPSRIRGRILVTAIVVGGATGTVTTALAGLGAEPWVIATVASASAAVGTIAAALSRANLTLDNPKDPQ
jgi:hypothetical protein